MTERAERLLAIADKLGLTEKQRTFCFAYIENGGNGVRAAEAAGYAGDYASHGTIAHENLNKLQIKEFIREIGLATGVLQRVEERILSASQVLEGLSSQSRADIGDFLARNQNGDIVLDFDLTGAQAAGKTKLIKELTIKSGADKDGMPWQETKIKLVDSQGALDKLARHYKLYGDAVTAPGNQINVGQVLVQVIGEQGPKPAQLVGLAKGLLGKPIEVEAERVE